MRPWVRLAILLGTAASAWGAAFSYSNDFNKYGKVQNQNCGIGGICGAVAMINSFVFLQNMYPQVYGNSPLVSNDPAADAMKFALGGWQAGNNPARQGYYNRIPQGQTGIKELWETKVDWVNDYAPGTTVFAGMTAFVDSTETWKAGQFVQLGYPTIAFLAEEIRRGEDVEASIATLTNSGAHAITITGIACDDQNNCTLKYQDPNFPTMERSVALTMNAMMGNRLQFSEVGTFNADVYLYLAFAESPVPEPGTIAFVLVGFTVLVVLKRRSVS